MSGPPYFFLSYAHSGPSSEGAVRTTDSEVRRFFVDLSLEVAERAGLAGADSAGFLDQNLPLGADWNAAITNALGRAQVFVPLYSPSYFNKSWPKRERESFKQRLTDAGLAEASARIMPVLWTPFASWEINDEISHAMALGADEPEYLENGMRALSILLEAPYKRLLNRLAMRIVECTELQWLEPSTAPDVGAIAETPPRDAQFVVAVIAPAGDNVPSDQQAPHYGPASKLWRPFVERQAQPVAEYVAGAAERLGSSTIVDGFTEVKEYLSRRPAIVLIDPWIVRTEGGLQSLLAAVDGLELWVPPLLIIDIEDPFYSAESRRLADEVTELMSSAGVRNVRKVSHLEELVNVVPRLITQALSQFLEHRRVRRDPGSPSGRYSLRDMPPSTNGKVDQ